MKAVLFIVLILASTVLDSSEIENALSSEKLVDVIIGNYKLKKKRVAIQFLKKFNVILSKNEINKIFKYLETCDEEELYKLYPYLKVFLQKKELLDVVFKSFSEMILKRDADEKLNGYLLSELYSISYLSNDKDLKKDFFIFCDKICNKDLKTILYLTKYAPRHRLGLCYIDFKFSLLDKEHEIQELSNKIWDIYLHCSKNDIIKLFLTNLTDKHYTSSLHFYFTKSLIAKLMNFADSNDIFKEDISEYLALYQIPTPYSATKKWWGNNNKNFSLVKYMFQLALNDEANAFIDSKQLLTYCGLFEIMYNQDYPGFKSLLKDKQDELIKKIFNEKESYIIRTNAFDLVECYQIINNKQNIPEIYYNVMDSFDVLSEKLKIDFISTLAWYDQHPFDKKIQTFLFNSVKSPDFSLKLRLTIASILVNRHKLISNKQEFTHFILGTYKDNISQVKLETEKKYCKDLLNYCLKNLTVAETILEEQKSSLNTSKNGEIENFGE